MQIEKEVVTTEVVGYQCDVCSRQVRKSQNRSITAMHYDWGNDSCDSVKTFDVCSKECYETKIRELCVSERYRKYRSYFDDIPISFWKYMLQIEDKEK